MTPENRIRIELQHRKNAAWASFHKHKKVILNRHVSVEKRLRFFDMCVSPSMMFALTAFPLTRSQIDEIDVLQRKMLRRIIGWRRIKGEAWDETMRRMRDRLESARGLYAWHSWSYRFFRDQWRFAIHLTKERASTTAKWMLTYNSSPKSDDEGIYIPHRDVGRPRTKWDDHLKVFFAHYFPERVNEHWSKILSSVERVSLEQVFIDFSVST